MLFTEGFLSGIVIGALILTTIAVITLLTFLIRDIKRDEVW